jgi:hypothetical protein
VLNLLLKLLALRPLLSMAVFGVPVLTLIAIAFFSVLAVKLIVIVSLSIALVVWLSRRNHDT